MTPIAPAPGIDPAAADYAKQIHVDAPREKVFDALTTLTGLASWWAPVTGSAAEGGELRFTFPPGIKVLHVEEATPSTVIWNVTSCDFQPDWVGTTLTFTLSPSGTEGHELQFRHEGLLPQLECYDQCSVAWGDHFLPRLQRYIESGTGSPYQLGG